MALHRPAAPRGRRLLRAAVCGVGLGVPVAALALVVRNDVAAVRSFDVHAVMVATDLTRSEPVLRTALLVWQEVSRPVWVNVAATTLCVWAWRRRGLGIRASWAFVTLMVAWGLQALTKLVVRRARPVVDDAIWHAEGFSFPSGHAANAAAAAVVVAVLLWPLLGPRARVAVPAAGAAFVGLTAVHRVLLGVHYPSDVVAGVLFGTAVTVASLVGYGGDASRRR